MRSRRFTVVGLGMIASLGVLLLAGCPPTPASPGPGNSGLTGKFIGSEQCAACHQRLHDSWAETLHAGALNTLEAYGQGTNEACLPCHTVGWGQDGGFVNRQTTDLLAGVGCEGCHGGARDHVMNVGEAALRPPVSIAASLCGQCHTGAHQPNFDDWKLSRHAAVEPELVPSFAAGTNLSTCGKCHSGDYFYHAILRGETVANNFLQGKTSDQMNAITCAICHNPHQRTGNAAAPEEGRDYQLRFPQIKYTTPTNTLAAVQDPTRFNLCGQCHHARDRVWTDSSREPHPSDQVNVFFGEMPLPASAPEPIVAPRPSVHLNTPEQCSTCHVFRRLPEGGIAPSVSGHTFEVNFEGCAECHSSAAIAEAKLAGLKTELDFRAELVKEALDAWGTDNNVDHKGALSWEFTSAGGPSATAQAKIPNNIKKARYIYDYVISGGGNGVHNPDYVRDALITALEYVQTAPPAQ